jgi:hypothetical protein
MTLEVSDVRSNTPEQIQNAATILGKSKQRVNVFEAIYKGKKKVKTFPDLLGVALQDLEINYRKIRILNITDYLETHGLVKRVKTKRDGRLAFEKIKFYSANYKKIVNYAKNPEKQKKLITKRTPIVKEIQSKIFTYKSPVNIQQITVDDIESFKAVKSFSEVKNVAKNILEKNIKKGFQNIIGEKGDFNDWGGEKNDLYTSRINLNGKRIASAIAFKGRATQGNLTPKKLGKNGDQVNRLFSSSAQLFLIVYHSRIEESVAEQMQAFATGISISGHKKIYYGIIDGTDLNRIISAYPDSFK